MPLEAETPLIPHWAAEPRVDAGRLEEEEK